MSLFTPFYPALAARLKLDISEADRRAFECLPERSDRGAVTMTDRSTGLRYSVSRADCGADCYCDALVLRQLDLH